MASAWPRRRCARRRSRRAPTRRTSGRTCPPGRHYDLCDTASCQVYGGASAEYSRANDAVDATAGQVLTYAGTPAFTQFSASNGGWSVAGSASQPYLVAKEDPFDHYDPDRVNGDGWRRTITSGAIESAYHLDNLVEISVETRDGNGTWGGRVVTVRLTSCDRLDRHGVGRQLPSCLRAALDVRHDLGRHPPLTPGRADPLVEVRGASATSLETR